MTGTLSIRNVILPVLLVVIWQLWSSFMAPEQSRMPVPVRVVTEAVSMIASGQLFSALYQSLGRVFLGFFSAGAIALLLGLVMGYSRTVERNLDPIVETFRPIAPIALLPLAILWFGTGTPASVFVVGYAAFFPMIVNTIHGVKGVDRRMVQAAQTMGLGRWKILWAVIVPAALPAIFVGARLAMGSSWLSIVAAELAVGSRSGGGGTGGIGQTMFIFYAYEIRLEGIVVCMISVGVVALCIDRGLRWVQRRVMPWTREIGR